MHQDRLRPLGKKLEEAGIAPNGEHAMEPIETAVLAVYQEMARSGRLVEKVRCFRAAV